MICLSFLSITRAINKGLYIRIKKYSVFKSIKSERRRFTLLVQVINLTNTFVTRLTTLCKQTVSIRNKEMIYMVLSYYSSLWVQDDRVHLSRRRESGAEPSGPRGQERVAAKNA